MLSRPKPKSLALFCLSTLVFIGSAQGAELGPGKSDTTGYRLIPGRISLQFEDWVSPTVVDSILLSYDGQILRINRVGTYHIRIPEHVDQLEVVADLEQMAYIRIAEPDVYYETFGEPNDARFDDQWSMHNEGGTDCKWDADVDAPAAWDVETGDSTLIVAVIDIGVDDCHLDLDGNVYADTAYDFIDDDDDPDPGTCGHGTMVAGVIAAETNSSHYVTGIAGGWGSTPGVQIMAIRAGGDPNCWDMDSAAIEDAIYFAVDNGADIINMSFGNDSTNALIAAAIDTAWNDGLLLVAASGNLGVGLNKIAFPANDEDVMAVGSTMCDDEHWGSSATGTGLSVVAPGGNVVPTKPEQAIISTHVNDDCDSLGYGAGTSLASPMVCGIAGLVWSADSTLTNEEVWEIIEDSAEDMVGDPNEDVLGFDQYHGYGRVNALGALLRTQGGGTVNTENLIISYDWVLTRDLLVEEGDTLTVLPGVTIQASGSDGANLGIDSSEIEIIVEGTLKALGTQANNIRFEGNVDDSPGHWYGIRFTTSASAGSLKHCHIESATKGISSDTVSYLSMEDCSFRKISQQGVYLEQSDSQTYLGDCSFTYCGDASIELKDCANVTVEDNTVTYATSYGIKVVDDSCSTIDDNAITGSDGYRNITGIYYEDSNGPFAITNNTLSNCRTKGIHVKDVADTNNAVHHNKIHDPAAGGSGTVGIQCDDVACKFRNNRIKNQTTGAHMTGTNYTPDFGDTTVSNGENCFENIGTYNICNKSSSSVTAQGNWRQAPGYICKGHAGANWAAALDSCPAGTPSKHHPVADRKPAVSEGSMSRSWPNPAKQGVSIAYALHEAGYVTLRIYNIRGQLVRTVLDAHQSAGQRSVAWDGRDEQGASVPAGLYFYRIEGKGFEDTKKLLILK
jgi:parallel beta-helix repeat protein